MSGKKNSNPKAPAGIAGGKELRPIRLTPSLTDYATAAELTSRMLGLTGIAASKRKPSKQLLSLAGLDA